MGVDAKLVVVKNDGWRLYCSGEMINGTKSGLRMKQKGWWFRERVALMSVVTR